MNQCFDDDLDKAIRSLPTPETTESYWSRYRIRLRRRIAPSWRRWSVAVAGTAAALAMILLFPRFPSISPPALVKVVGSPPRPTAYERFQHTFEAYLQSGDAHVLAAADGLIERFWSRALPKLSSADPNEVRRTLRVLERVRQPALVSALERQLDATEWRREAIYHTLVKLDLPDSYSVLRKALQDPNDQSAALSALKEAPLRQALPLVLDVYPLFSHDLLGRADEIALSDSVLTRDWIRRRLPSLNEKSFVEFIPLIGKARVKEALPRLLGLAQGSPSRPEILDALRLMTCEVHHLVLDKDVNVALLAIPLLPEIRNEETLKTLKVLVGRRQTHAVSIRALARMGGAEVVRILAEVYTQSPAKSEILAVLSELPPVDDASPLLRIAANGQTSIHAVRTLLASYPRERIIPSLIHWLTDPRTRSRGHEILEQLTRQRLPAQLRAWEQWWKLENQG